MSREFALWRADGSEVTRLSPTGVPLEAHLEQYIESDPSLIGERLLIIGRQVATEFGGFIDLLALDADGALHVLELKRDRTPREVVAQVLDYGSWVATLPHDDIVEIYERYRASRADLPAALDAAFAERFGDSPPEELNAQQRLVIVASNMDPATERIVSYLHDAFDVPINVVFFNHFRDGDVSYLGRSWLVASAEEQTTAAARSRRTIEPWNGLDWYVSFGESAGGRNWEDARTFGFVSAGGGEWYSRTIRNLPIGARVFACIPKRGYVGVGTVTGEAMPFSQAVLDTTNGKRLADQNLVGTYVREGASDTPDTAEYVVPVTWERAVPAAEAIWQTGMFANQNSACKLRKRFTIETVLRELGL